MYDKIKKEFDKLVLKGKLYGTSEEFRQFVRKRTAKTINRITDKVQQIPRISGETRSGIEQNRSEINIPDIKKDSINNQQTRQDEIKIEKATRDSLYKWYGNIEKARFDVDKDLNHFKNQPQKILAIKQG